MDIIDKKYNAALAAYNHEVATLDVEYGDTRYRRDEFFLAMRDHSEAKKEVATTLRSLADNMRLDDRVRDKMKDMAVEVAQDAYNEDNYVANISNTPCWSSHILHRASPFERGATDPAPASGYGRGEDDDTQVAA